ncbi:MAG TPA: hypothetical protein VGM29_19085 [Polyangiaceae bacterium]|jgi:hypothetical protein
MGCLIGCLAIGFPRLALFLVWLFGGSYLHRAYGSFIWPLLGFFFLPLTTLTFAFSLNSLGGHGQMPPLGWLLVALAAAADFGLIGGGQHGLRRYRRDGWR